MSGSASTIASAGGLVGKNDGSIDRSFSKIQIRLTSAATNAYVGGFVGQNTSTGTIDQSYADVVPLTGLTGYLAGAKVGGFVGWNDTNGKITNAYATSAVEGGALNTWDAGFAYKNSGTIANSYAVSNSPDNSKPRYGFVFDNTGGTITNDYWSSTTTSGATAATDTSPAHAQPNAHRVGNELRGQCLRSQHVRKLRGF
jgi:hypothetical protein